MCFTRVVTVSFGMSDFLFLLVFEFINIYYKLSLQLSFVPSICTITFFCGFTISTYTIREYANILLYLGVRSNNASAASRDPNRRHLDRHSLESCLEMVLFDQLSATMYVVDEKRV